MSATSRPRRRPAIQITDARAARLHRMVRLLVDGPRSRDELLRGLKIGLRTFYRELELLRRCGVKVRLARTQYHLQSTLEQAEGLLPFPDPRLSFAEIRELASGSGPAARRLSAMLKKVLDQAPERTPTSTTGKRARGRPSRKGPAGKTGRGE